MTTSHNSETTHKRTVVTSNPGEQVGKSQPQVYQDGNSSANGSSRPAKTDATRTVPYKGITGRQRRAYSPPRKKSKYSAFSAEVDKALAVIHKELEKAAHMGRAEGGFQDTIQALEQQLKLKDGQIQLGIKELEFAKRQRGESNLLEAENKTLKEENAKLVVLVDRKDAELKDWRAKLRNMIGSELD
jgi:hypothetical protein